MAPNGSGTGGKQRQTAPFTYRRFGWCSWLSSLAPPLSGIDRTAGSSGLARIRRWNRVVVNGTDCGFFQACGLPGCHFAGTSFPLRPGTRYPLVLLVRKIVAITLPPGARAVAIGHRPVSTPPREHMQARSTQRGTPQQAVWGEWYAPYSRNEWHAQAQIRFRSHTPSVKQSCPRACEMMPHEPKAEPKAGGPVRAK
jgi:hypothetical protein